MMRSAERDLATALPPTPQDVVPEAIPAEPMPGVPEDRSGRPGAGPPHPSGDRLAEVLRALAGRMDVEEPGPSSRIEADAARDDGARTCLAMIGLSFR